MARSELHRVACDHAAWVEPLDAWRLLHDAGHRALLLDGMGRHPHARYAYVAHAPALEVEIRGDTVTERRGGDAKTFEADPLQYVDRVAEAHRFDVDEPEGFTGGFVGLFGYEFARAVEPTLPAPRSLPETPDAVLWLCRDVIVFDREAKTVRLYAADLDRPADADARLGATTALLPHASSLCDIAPATQVEPTWTTSMDAPAFEAAVRDMKQKIAEGDLFQANIATRFQTPCNADPATLFAALRSNNPSPYMALLDFGAFHVVSGSPEQLFAVQDGRIQSRPIAGTRPRGVDRDADDALERELLADPKEQAEHTMLVDLVRNDLARVSVPGSVCVTEHTSVERYRHVMHLVSLVEGQVRPDSRFSHWLSALFPGGTITGAPKHRACIRIHEAEPVPRGPYTGSAGYLSWSHNAHWNILIRTLTLKDGVASVHAGSGIVADSDPAREWQEAGHKARALLEAATGHAGRTGNPADVGTVRRHGAWHLPTPGPVATGRRVLLIDNYDSFVHNLADYCAALGAHVETIRNDADWEAVATRLDPTHVIISPGPGRPEEAGCSMEAIRHFSGKVPVLGVCLGHQAIAAAFGGRVVQHVEPVHGKTDTVLHDGDGLLAGIPSPTVATRYHSLVTPESDLPPELAVCGRLADGTVMALRHRRHPTFGLQFHPESIGTPDGIAILATFLASS